MVTERGATDDRKSRLAVGAQVRRWRRSAA